MTFSFERSAFGDARFSHTSFVASKRNIPMRHLRSDLGDALKSLRNDLELVINNDYAVFIALPSLLLGADALIEAAKKPLDCTKTTFQNHHIHVNQHSLRIDHLLMEKRVLAVRIESLQNLAAISVLVNHLFEISHTTVAGMQRVAHEYIKLKHLIAKEKQHPFVLGLATKLERIKLSIFETLSSLFASSLISESRNEQNSGICALMRIFTSLECIDDAKQVFKETLVYVFVNELIRGKPQQHYISMVKDGNTSLFFEKIYLFLKSIKPVCNVLDNQPLSSGHNFFVQVVWHETACALIENTVIFLSGDPNAFHSTYKSGLAFIQNVESICVLPGQLNCLRGCTSFQNFMKKWQSGIYFQLRQNEITEKFEAAINLGENSYYIDSNYTSALGINNENYGSVEETAALGYDHLSLLRFVASLRLVECLTSFWHESVYIHTIAAKFWKLTLLLIARYQNWAGSLCKDIVVDETSNEEQDINKSENSMATLLAVYSDSIKMTPIINELFNSVILPQLKLDNDSDTAKILFAALQEAISHTTILAIETQIIGHVSRQCIDPLKNIMNIPGQYRRTNRDIPTQASVFLENLFEASELFFLNSNIHIESRLKWRTEIAKRILDAFVINLGKMLMSVRQIEESLKRFKKKTDGNIPIGVSDEDKIRAQVRLDIAFVRRGLLKEGLNVASLGELDSITC